ncbi:hypothetical protein BZL29_3717 [Mycobacterium kansasii]|uniref:Uncharacterized protein n=1 Tax=Mycobacterium kansasii TaxID=1768 RepID=A0A1V3XG44_MYCKA|nr:hypothetical protein BZL29_3717 [Mycobacterium kansasii]
MHRFAARVDDREFDAAAALFTAAAELTTPDPPATLTPVHSHRGQLAIATAIAAVAQTMRTEHAIVGEVYDQARGRVSREGASPASRTIGAGAAMTWSTWCGICATTTSTG